MRRFLSRLLPTLHQRLVVIIALSMVTCLAVLGLASFSALRSIEQNRLQVSLISELSYASDAIEREYRELIGISEQMIPQSHIGQMVEDYYAAESQYERYEILSLLPTVSLPISLSNYALLNFFYYAPDGEKNPFTYMRTDPDFDLNALPVLYEGGVVRYNGAHGSSSYGVSSDVLSILRPISISDRELLIYVEARSPIKALLSEYDSGLPYIILQLDGDGRIVHSSDPAFEPGEALTLRGGNVDGVRLGLSGEYYGAVMRSRIGFSTALLLPERVYHNELNMWRLRVWLIVLLSALLLFGVSFSLRRLIYRPMEKLELEMARVGRGELDAVNYRSSVAEYDALFARFGQMKRNLQESIRERELMHAENHRLEMEKLLYQINPHFLMNTLNSVHWMAKIGGQGEIASFITDLSYILGYSLKKTEPVATLRTELRYVTAYLSLQKRRYDFSVAVDVEEGLYLDSPTARMILQPIAENAIQHGMDDNSTLRLCVFHDEDRGQAMIEIEDDGKSLSAEEFMDVAKRFDGTEAEGKKPCGIGLRYVRSMLAEHYGGSAEMAITRRQTRGTRVTLFLPLSEKGGFSS